MKSSQIKILTAGDMSGTVHSQVIDLSAVSLGSIQVVYSGAPTGSVYLEISNDILAPGADPNSSITNWDQYGNAQAIAAAGHTTFNISNMGYKWCRLTYVPAGGSGSIDATAEIKDV